MARHFNTAGPCRADLHYMLPPDRRLHGVRALIDRQTYFVLHAPRQIGKTTSLLALARALTAEGRYAAVLVSMEAGAAFSGDVGAAELAVLGAWRRSAAARLPADLQPPPWPDAPPGARIATALSAWAIDSPRPLVVFLDEIDAPEGDALVSVLRQLRDGFETRPAAFPWSLALIGMRDVRDYKVVAGADRARSASPFNIMETSLTMRDFSAAEVGELYAQHTADTSQRFEDAAVARAFELSRGQPWLVNALAARATRDLVPDVARAFTAADIDAAREILIRRQDTHLDSLIERLHEERVRRVIAPMIAGDLLAQVPDDDRRLVVDLGLVRRDPDGGLDVANPIYREVIARALTQGVFDAMPRVPATWLGPDGGIDCARLLTAWLAFWRQHGEALLATAPYAEVAAQLVMMAFLHRVANGGGVIEREYALGRGRIDLCLRYGPTVLAVELKVWRSRQRDPEATGLAQLDAYLDAQGPATAWLVIFDQRARRPSPSKRTRTARKRTPSGRAVTVVRL